MLSTGEFERGGKGRGGTGVMGAEDDEARRCESKKEGYCSGG